jgi:protein dithiol oxidoreductase (disulfide-forming)
MKKLLLLAAASALLAACGAKNTDTASTPATEPAPAVAATPAAPASTPEAAVAAEPASESSLERVVTMPENAQLPSGKWQAGTHYKPLVPAQNTSAEPGQVEILEFMWLGCAHCADLQPTMDAWSKQKPAHVKFVQEHVMWGAAHKAHGKLLYTLQALNRGDLVSKAFDEIHLRKNMLVSLKGDDAETAAIQLAFAKANGISEADFKREYSGFGVTARLQKAEELNRRYRVESVPTIYINGKYETSVSMAGGKSQLIQLLNDLAAAEKVR